MKLIRVITARSYFKNTLSNFPARNLRSLSASLVSCWRWCLREAFGGRKRLVFCETKIFRPRSRRAFAAGAKATPVLENTTASRTHHARSACETVFSVTSGVIIVLFLLGRTTFAATEFLTSWKADSYVPYFYQGKTLPSPHSNVTVSFEILSSGRPLDIANRTVRWYLDNQLYQSGIGLKTISFKTNAIKQTDYQLKISLPKFSNGKDLEEFLVIPLTSPEAVIDAPYSNNLVSEGINLLRGLLYFFNTRDLTDITLTWTANGQKTSASVETPDILELRVPANISGNLINVGLMAKNTKNELEFADALVSLTVK